MNGVDSQLRNLQSLLQRQQRAYRKQGRPDISIRQNRLDRVVSLVVDNQHALCDELAVDFGGGSRRHFLATEITPTISAIEHAKRHLPVWIKPASRDGRSKIFASTSATEIHYQPKGVVGIKTTWRMPVWSSLGSLASIFSAGNRCVIELSGRAHETAGLLEKLAGQYFDQEELAFVQGDDQSNAFLQLPFDHFLLFGTGQDALAARRAIPLDAMIPVTFVLSGKSPTIIGKKADLRRVAATLVLQKCARAGQELLSTECVFVRNHDLNELIAEIERASQHYFPAMLKNPDYGALINLEHYQRMQHYLDDAKSHGGEVWEANLQKENFRMQPGSHKMPLTLVINPLDDMTLMQEEICGPVMAIKGYAHLDDVMDDLPSRKNLVWYYFGRDRQEWEKILKGTDEGAVVANPDRWSFAELLSLGCSGADGTGYIHGVEGFRTFSHARTVHGLR